MKLCYRLSNNTLFCLQISNIHKVNIQVKLKMLLCKIFKHLLRLDNCLEFCFHNYIPVLNWDITPSTLLSHKQEEMTAVKATSNVFWFLLLKGELDLCHTSDILVKILELMERCVILTECHLFFPPLYIW